MYPHVLITRQAQPGASLRLGRVVHRFLLLLFLAFPAIGGAATPSISASTQIANGGYFQLDWQTEGNGHLFQIEESRDTGFAQPRLLYQGPDTSRIVSGRSNGEYYYRARLLDEQQQAVSAWSQPIQVTVEHHPLQRALMFFVIGLLVFCATLVAIVRGTRQSH